MSEKEQANELWLYIFKAAFDNMQSTTRAKQEADSAVKAFAEQLKPKTA